MRSVAFGRNPSPPSRLRTRPRFLVAEHGARRLVLPWFRFGEGTRRVLFTGGVHGWEHSGIETAWRLAEALEGLQGQVPLRGTVDILPVANPAAFAAERRAAPEDGIDLGVALATSPVDSRPAAGSEGSLTAALARSILELAAGVEWGIDFHAAGEARYLPHVIFHRLEDAGIAREWGLPFAILRTRNRDGQERGTLARAIVGMGGSSLTLELGGGLITFPEDIELGLKAALAFLSRRGFLGGTAAYTVKPTPEDRVYLEDTRVLVRSDEEGAFYPDVRLGAAVRAGQRLGCWLPLTSLEPREALAPEDGWIIYLRMRCRTPSGSTLAMLLP